MVKMREGIDMGLQAASEVPRFDFQVVEYFESLSLMNNTPEHTSF